MCLVKWVSVKVNVRVGVVLQGTKVDPPDLRFKLALIITVRRLRALLLLSVLRNYNISPQCCRFAFNWLILLEASHIMWRKFFLNLYVKYALSFAFLAINALIVACRKPTGNVVVNINI